MLNIILLILNMFWSSTPNYICYDVYGFNLQQFDDTENILVGTVVQLDTVKSSNDFEIQPYNNILYHYKIIKSFKSELTIDTIILRPEMGYGVNWLPKLDGTYILYLDSQDKDEILNKEYYEIQDCHRFLKKGSTNFDKHLNILEMLEEKADEEFIINFEIEKSHNYHETLIIVSGRFENGFRHGEWNLYHPYINGVSDSITNKVAIRLMYEYGDIISVTQIDNGESEETHVTNWFNWYSNQVKL